MNLFIDESIHTDLGFIVTAFVFVEKDITLKINSALIKAGLTPSKDEFKSGARMHGNESLQNLRSDLFGIISQYGKIAFLFTSEMNRKELGSEALVAMQEIFKKNGISPEATNAYFDEGMFPSINNANNTFNSIPKLKSLKFYPEQDSKTCLGIQLADALAHLMSQIVRSAVIEKPKLIDIGGENTGYPAGTEAELGWALLMTVRYNFLSRQVLPEGHDYEPDTNPLIHSEDEDHVELAINPELIGWGIHFGKNIPTSIEYAVYKKLDKIWLGCIH